MYKITTDYHLFLAMYTIIQLLLFEETVFKVCISIQKFERN